MATDNEQRRKLSNFELVKICGSCFPFLAELRLQPSQQEDGHNGSSLAQIKRTITFLCYPEGEAPEKNPPIMTRNETREVAVGRPTTSPEVLKNL